MKAEPLADHIKRKHGSNKAYAEHIGKSAPHVSRDLKKRYWVIEGELYGPVKKT